MQRKMFSTLLICVGAAAIVFAVVLLVSAVLLPSLPGSNGPVYSHGPIPPGYFANAKPAVPQPADELMTMVFSRGTYDSMISPDSDELVLLPSSAPDNFTEVSTNLFVEPGIDQDDPVVMFRMPVEMYERYLSEGGEDQYIPAEFYFREFDTLTIFSEKIGVTVE